MSYLREITQTQNWPLCCSWRDTASKTCFQASCLDMATGNVRLYSVTRYVRQYSVTGYVRRGVSNCMAKRGESFTIILCVKREDFFFCFFSALRAKSNLKISSALRAKSNLKIFSARRTESNLKIFSARRAKSNLNFFSFFSFSFLYIYTLRFFLF